MRLAASALLVTCAMALTACGNALRMQPIPHNVLEGLIVTPFPVYWLGGSFHGLTVTEASGDPSGGYSIQYGNCLEGGQGACVPALRVITSADNSFVPGLAAPNRSIQLRGVTALLAQRGQTIMIPTGPVVVGIYANDRRLAGAAARTVVPINQPGAPGGPLPPRQPDTGYGETPLSTQEPTPLVPVR